MSLSVSIVSGACDERVTFDRFSNDRFSKKSLKVVSWLSS